MKKEYGYNPFHLYGKPDPMGQLSWTWGHSFITNQRAIFNLRCPMQSRTNSETLYI